MKKLIALLLTLLMLVGSLPLGTGTVAAEESGESPFFVQMHGVTRELGALELELIEQGLSREEVISAMLEAARADERVDESSIVVSDCGFDYRTAMGGCCQYDYDLNRRMEDVQTDALCDEVQYEAPTLAKRGDNREHNVLLVGPWYTYPGQDGFDDDYKNRCDDYANYTGGSFTLLSGRCATVDNIAQAMYNSGVVLFDSHGNTDSSGKCSYLMLSTKEGLTEEDFTKGYAIDGTSDYERYGINGDALRVRIEQYGSLPNTFVYAGICYGMATNGLCDPLINAGAAAYFGFTKVVSFAGDLTCQKVIFNKLMTDATLATSFNLLTNGDYNIAGGAFGSACPYPFLRSAVDSYPTNLTTKQTAKCTWKMPKAATADPDIYQYEKVTDLTTLSAGEEYLITYTSGSTAYIVSTACLFQGTSGDMKYTDYQFPQMPKATVALDSETGLYNVTMSTLLYGDEPSDFGFIVGGNNTDGYTFYNDTVHMYLAMTAKDGVGSGTYGNPALLGANSTAVTNNYHKYKVSGTQKLYCPNSPRNNSTGNYSIYLQCDTADDPYLDNEPSSSATNFTFYRLVNPSAEPTATPTPKLTPTPAPTATPTPVPTATPKPTEIPSAGPTGTPFVPSLDTDRLTDTSDRENFPQFPNEGAVRVDKDVVDTSIYNQTGVAQIELQVAGISETEPVDVVLVIDTSASMDDIPSGDTVSKMVSAKAAAKNFVASLVKNADGTFNENRVAIVEFFDYAVEISGMTHVKSATELTALQNKITAIDATEDGGTNYDDPLLMAGDILEAAKAQSGYEDRKRVVVFMTDGAPGIYNRANPFRLFYYGAVTGEPVDRRDYVSSQVALCICDYFWETASEVPSAYTNTDTKYTYSATSYSYKGGASTAISYLPSGTVAQQTALQTFLNAYWYDYVSGRLSASDWAIKRNGNWRYEKTTSLASGNYYLLATDVDGAPHILGPDYDKTFTDAGYWFPYFATVSATKDGNNGLKIAITDTASDLSSPDTTLSNYWLLSGGSSNAWTFRSYKYMSTSNSYLRMMNLSTSRPGFGTNVSDYNLYKWRYDGTYLRNAGYGSITTGNTYLRCSGDTGNRYINHGTSSTRTAFYFYKRIPGPLAAVPSELQTHLLDDNIFGARLKGTATQAQLNSWNIDGAPLDAEIYTIGFDMGSGSTIHWISKTNGIDVRFTGAQCETILDQMATSGQSVNAANQAELNAAYEQIAAELNIASATNTQLTDYMGTEFDLQLFDTVNTENGTEALGFTPTVQLGYYELDENANRGTFHALETLTFSGSNLVNLVATSSAKSGNCYDASTKILTGQYVTYDFNEERFSTSVDLHDSREYTLNYWVHLTGSSEGERQAGTYETNQAAFLDYTNPLNNDCRQTFPVPSLPWGSALTRYEYYLVNENGQPINEDGEVISFAERIIVGTAEPIPFLLNSTQTVHALSTVPDGYALFNGSAHYTVYADSDGTGTVQISDNTQTTYLVAPSVSNSNGALTNLSGYTATSFSFAVVVPKKPEVSMYTLGAQAHILHQTAALEEAGLYTDGIRFGYAIDYTSLQEVLSPGDRFNTGLLLMPLDKLGTSNTDYANAALMTLSVGTDGTFDTPNSSAVFMGKLQSGNTFPYKKLDSTSMLTWTEAMDTATSAKALATLLEENGLVVFDVSGDEIRLMAYVLFGTENCQQKADREIAFRGFTVILSSDGYTVTYAQQYANCATRIFNDYNYRHYGISNVAGATVNELLNGASRFAPTNQ